MIYLFIISLKILFCSGLFSNNSAVLQLNVYDFDIVYDSEKMWLIDFYSPWDEISEDFAKHYEHIALTLKGIMNVAVLNCDTGHYFCKQHGLNTLPALRFYGITDSINGSDYIGARTPEAVLQSAIIALRRRFLFKAENFLPKSSYKQSIVQLTDSNFDEHVTNSDLTWVVEFYSSSCGMTRAFTPKYEKIAKEIRKDGIFCAAITIDNNMDKVKEYRIIKYPVFLYFPRGLKNVHSVERYNSSLDSTELLDWIYSVHNATLKLPTIYQLIDESIARQACEHTEYCILIVIPSIKYCNATCRHENLNIVQDVSAIFKTYSMGWLWFEYGAQKAIEKVLSMKDDNSTKIFVVNLHKKNYMTTNKPFTVEEVASFLGRVKLGKAVQRDIKIQKLPRIFTTDLWNGESKATYIKDEL